MSTPVVVQGTAVSDPYVPAQQQYVQSQAAPANDDYGGDHHGTKQETKCRDPIFAVCKCYDNESSYFTSL